MGFEDESLLLLDLQGERPRLFAAVREDRRVPKLHARLHDDCNHPLPGHFQSTTEEGLPSQLQSALQILSSSDRQTRLDLLPPTGNWNLGSDHIIWRWPTRRSSGRRSLRSLAQVRGAFGNHLVV